MPEQTVKKSVAPSRRESRKQPVLTLHSSEQIAYGEFHPRPARSALQPMMEHYEPPYESPEMPLGQRAEHPEYDTGHAVARPMELEEEEAA